MELRIEVDDELANSAQLIYDTLGINTETAVRMFLKRTVLEQRLSLNTSVSGVERFEAVEAPDARPKRSKNVSSRASRCRSPWA